MLEMFMGTGKSRVAINLLESSAWRTSNRPPRVLIVCPVAVVPAWRKQFMEHATVRWGVLEFTHSARLTAVQPIAGGRTNHGSSVYIPKLSIGKRLPSLANFLRVSGEHGAAVVTNYETARDPRFVEACTGVFDVVIADESHRMKNPKSACYKALRRLGLTAKRRLCLTGTPRPHSPADVWSQYSFLDPSLLDKSFFLFRMRYAVLGGFGGKQVLAWRNLDDLAARLSPATFVCGKDVLSLPETLDVTIEVELDSATMLVHERLRAGLRAELEAGPVTPKIAIVRLLRLQQVTSGYVTVDREVWDDDQPVLQELGTAKLDALVDMVEDLPPSEPFVVFCRFRHDITRVRTALEMYGGSCELSGSANQLEEWQAGGKRALVVQTKSGGAGIDLVRASYAFYFSIDFSLGDYEQSRARLHRPGQTRKVTYYHLVAKDTADELVYSALERRQVDVGKVLDELVRLQESREV